MLAVVLAGLVAVVLVAAAVLVPLLVVGDGDDEGSATVLGPRSDDGASAGGLDGVKTYDDLSYQHLAVGEDHDYPQSPPVGGDHAPVWLECGVYDRPVPDVNAVHDLEHGATWLTYRPEDVDAAGVRALARLLPANGLLSPYPAQSAPVVITVWGRQLALTGPDDPRIALFLAAYGGGTTAPEPFASCNGGVAPEDVPEPGGPVI